MPGQVGLGRAERAARREDAGATGTRCGAVRARETEAKDNYLIVDGARVRPAHDGALARLLHHGPTLLRPCSDLALVKTPSRTRLASVPPGIRPPQARHARGDTEWGCACVTHAAELE